MRQEEQLKVKQYLEDILNSNANLTDTDLLQALEAKLVSNGLSYLIQGYLEYAEEVIKGRALPSIYDGLKPVNRRICYTLFSDKVYDTDLKHPKSFMKSARISGNVLKLHPHGDAAVYEAMVLMTDKNGSLAFPLIEGTGNFGGVYKDDPPAASRYTEAKLAYKAKNEYFTDLHGINFVDNFDSTEKEPEFLPVSFPAVLVNSISGIAVGFSCKIPSFNFVDVCKLVIEYLETGKCTTVITPDFVTGGYYIKDNKELMSLMTKGKGNIKLRAKTEIDGKQIRVTEVPFGTTIQKLITQINNLEANSIRNAYDTDDFEHGASFTIDCSAKTKVDEALHTVLKKTDMQTTFNANITVIKNDAPVQLGVWQIIEDWTNWRIGVLTKEYTYQRDQLIVDFAAASAFMNIVNAYDKKMELVKVIADQGRKAGKDYIMENFTREEVPEDQVEFCATRSLPSYYDGGEYAKLYKTGAKQLKALDKALKDISKVVKKQMQDLIEKYGAEMKRRTLVTDKDVVEENKDLYAKKELDTTKCSYEIENNFIRKVKGTSNKETGIVLQGTASDILMAIDDKGRILRIYCQDLGYSTGNDVGTYLPNYFNIAEKDFGVFKWLGKLEGQELMLLYKDGYVGFVDTNEWLNNSRNVKVIERGIAVKYAGMLGAVIEGVPDVLYVSDTNGNLGVVNTSSIERKGRTSRTKAFAMKKDATIDSYLANSVEDMPLVNDLEKRIGALKPVDVSNFLRADNFVDIE